MHKTHSCNSAEETVELGKKIGSRLRGGEVFELMSDLGGGKTTFVRGLAKGFGSLDPVASPSFTISYVYGRPDGKQLYHFDFYRLNDAGVVGNELAEVEGDTDVVVAVEWGDIVHDVMSENRVKVKIEINDSDERILSFEYPKIYQYLFEGI